MFPSPGYTFLAFAVLFFVGTHGCTPGAPLPTERPRPTKITTTTTRRTTTTTPPDNTLALHEPFSMDILPPLAWSVPSLRDELRRSRSVAATVRIQNSLQASNEAEAKRRANDAIQKNLNKITSLYNFSSISVRNLSFPLILADVVEAKDGKCTATSLHNVVLSETDRTIIKKCDTDNSVKDFDLISFTGNFSGLTEDQWNIVADELKNLLVEIDDVSFPGENSIVIGRRETTTTVEVTTKEATTTKEEHHPSTIRGLEETTTEFKTTTEVGHSTLNQDTTTSKASETTSEGSMTTTTIYENEGTTTNSLKTESSGSSEATTSVLSTKEGLISTTAESSETENWTTTSESSEGSTSTQTTETTADESHLTNGYEESESTAAFDKSTTTEFTRTNSPTAAEVTSRTEESTGPTTPLNVDTSSLPEFTSTAAKSPEYDGTTTDYTLQTLPEEPKVSTSDTPENVSGDVVYLTMEIQPPIIWTYPSKSSEEDVALNQARVDFQYETNKALSQIEAIVQIGNIDGLPIPADIATVFQNELCAGPSRDYSVILSENGKTVTRKCNVTTGIITPFDFIPVTVQVRPLEDQPTIPWQTVLGEIKTLLENDCFVIFRGAIGLLGETTTTERPLLDASPYAAFSMSILPPTSWSFPSKTEYKKGNQKETAEDAREQIKSDLLEAANAVLISYSMPENGLKITIDENVAVKADIAVVNSIGQCGAVSEFSVILKPETTTIEKICPINGPDPIDFPPVVVSGNFEAPATIPLNYWQILVAELKEHLEAKDVEFPEGNEISLKLLWNLTE